MKVPLFFVNFFTSNHQSELHVSDCVCPSSLMSNRNRLFQTKWTENPNETLMGKCSAQFLYRTGFSQQFWPNRNEFDYYVPTTLSLLQNSIQRVEKKFRSSQLHSLGKSFCNKPCFLSLNCTIWIILQCKHPLTPLTTFPFQKSCQDPCAFFSRACISSVIASFHVE